ncbi:MAG: hypothetical protein HY369_03375 [Candidatus Aenigmarchaeota archaeon]|nr:hypothetical protein [Candidatus Aenigmarchaeota archaeon]
MDKTAVLALLKRGRLLSADLGAQLDPAAIDGLTDGLVAAAAGDARVQLPLVASQVTVQDVTSFALHKFTGIRALLLPKLAPISIGNTLRSFGSVTLIGMVREPVPGGFVLEDPTGAIAVLAADRPDPRDVVGVRGQMREGKVLLQELIYPDLPLPTGDKPAATLLLTPTPLAQPGHQVAAGTGNLPGIAFVPRVPAWVQVAGAQLLIATGAGNPQGWLKKRHLPETITSARDDYLIDRVPDILWVWAAENKASIYKGVTIVQTDPRSWARVENHTGTVTFGSI